MQVLIIGAGGREHALAWKIAQSTRVSKVFVAPGNAGTANDLKMENVAIDTEDIGALKDFAAGHGVDFTVVGPEAPLVNGIVDEFKSAELPIFGPQRAPAQLEGSKKFAKDFLARHGIPTASYATFTTIDEAQQESYESWLTATANISANSLGQEPVVVPVELRGPVTTIVRDRGDAILFSLQNGF